MKLSDLQPGDVVRDTALNITATLLVVHTPHPLYPQLALVIWWMNEEQRWSFDALHPHMEMPYEQRLQPPAGMYLPAHSTPDAAWFSARRAELRRILFIEQRQRPDRSRRPR